MILACEQHIDWIADCVHYLYDHGFTRIEAEQDAEDAWVRHNNEVADRTLYPLANSCSLRTPGTQPGRKAESTPLGDGCPPLAVTAGIRSAPLCCSMRSSIATRLGVNFRSLISVFQAAFKYDSNICITKARKSIQ